MAQVVMLLLIEMYVEHGCHNSQNIINVYIYSRMSVLPHICQWSNDDASYNKAIHNTEFHLQVLMWTNWQIATESLGISVVVQWIRTKYTLPEIVPHYDKSIKLGTLILDTLRNILRIASSLGSLSVNQGDHFNKMAIIWISC
jgi:hypothetical protein